MNNLHTLQGLFNEIQKCESKEFSQNIQLAVNLIPKDESFIMILHTLLGCKNNSWPPRVNLFIKRVFEELITNNSDAIEGILKYCVLFVESKSKKCRKHALRLIHTINEIKEFEMGADRLQIISEHLFDKDAGVRKEALKICLTKQNKLLNESLHVEGVLKDVLRYDANLEIRKMALSLLQINKSTLNCVIERSIDSNVKIRIIFWQCCFLKIKVEELSKQQRIFLLRNAQNEREFDAKQIFQGVVKRLGIVKFVGYFYDRDGALDVFIDEYLKDNNIEFGLEKDGKLKVVIDGNSNEVKEIYQNDSEFEAGYIYFLNKYYKLIEENEGRDRLNMLELEELLELIYNKSIEVENKVREGVILNEEIDVVTGMLRLLVFYDIFVEDVKQMVLAIIKVLLIKCNVREIVEEAVLLCKRICNDEENIKFFRKIIAKTKESDICYIVCEYVMKHLKYGILHENIVSDISIPNIPKSIDILFWHILHKPGTQIEELYFSYLPTKRVLEGTTDLVLSGVLQPENFLTVVQTQIAALNENAVVPITKLILAEFVDSEICIKYLLIVYYSTDNEYLQQHLSIFFTEFFFKSSKPLIECFCEVVEIIVDNHKVFIDQCLFWIHNSAYFNGSQLLFYSVGLFLYKNYDLLKTHKLYFYVLEKINISPCWNNLLTKKIIYIITQIIKRRPRQNVNLLLNRLMEIDDGYPMNNDDFNAFIEIINTTSVGTKT